MARKNLETIQDLFDYAVSRGLAIDNRKWRLDIYTRREYVDPIAGADWRQNLADFDHSHYPDWTPEARAERQTMLEKQPEEKVVTTYTLNMVSSDLWSRGTSVDLGEELGKMVESIWTKTPDKYWGSSMNYTGRLTLQGILKRLGRSDFSDAVADAKKAIAERDRRNNRAYIRRETDKAVTELRKWLDKAAAEGMINKDIDLNDLLVKED